MSQRQINRLIHRHAAPFFPRHLECLLTQILLCLCQITVVLFSHIGRQGQANLFSQGLCGAPQCSGMPGFALSGGKGCEYFKGVGN
jgi:hypothetical protein